MGADLSEVARQWEPPRVLPILGRSLGIVVYSVLTSAKIHGGEQLTRT